MEDIQLGKGFFVKDHHFYKGTENTWNRPSWSSAKTFGFYHKNNLRKQHLLKGKIDDMIKESKASQTAEERDRVVKHRQQSLSRLVDRKIERLVVQNKCNQQVETNPNEHAISKIENLNPREASKCVMNKSGVRNLLKVGDDNLWNDYNRLSEKSVKMLIPRSIISNDERATSLIMSKIQDERVVKSERAKRQLSTHHEIYQYEKSLKNKNSTRYSCWGYGSNCAPTNRQSTSQFEITGGPGRGALPQLSRGALERANQDPGNQQSSMAIFDNTERAIPQEIAEDVQEANIGGETGHSAKFGTQSVSQQLREPNLTVRTEEYSEFRGLHIPILNKDSASMNIPYTKFVLDHSELARNRVAQEYWAKGGLEELDRHTNIRTAKKVKSHLPSVQTAKASKYDLRKARPVPAVPGEDFDSKRVGSGNARMCLRNWTTSRK